MKLVSGSKSLKRFSVGGQMVQAQSAEGMSGKIIQAPNGKFYFRVQISADGSSRDFEVCLSALNIQITDSHAGLYETEDGAVRILGSGVLEP